VGSIIVLGMIVLFVGGAVGGTALAVSLMGRDKRSRPALTDGRRDPMNLRLNDVLVHFGTTWIVAGRLRCDEPGTTWFIYRLEDGDQERYLRVRRLDQLQMELIETCQEQPRGAGDPARQLAHDGTDYTLKGWAQVRVLHEGRTGRVGSRLELHEYGAPGQKVVLLERWAETEWMGVGRRLEVHHLEIFPGDAVEDDGQTAPDVG